VQCAAIPVSPAAGPAAGPPGSPSDSRPDSAIQTTLLEAFDSSGLALAPPGAGWLRQLDPGGRPRWEAEGQSAAVEIALPPASIRRVVAPIDRALLRTLVDADGTTRTRAQYRLAPALRDLPLRLPTGWRPTAAWWNGEPVPLRASPAELDRGTPQLIVAPPGTPRGTSVVTVEFETPQADIAGLGQQLELAPPTLPGDRTPAETLWQITVADDQYLLGRPAGFAPAYGWRWSGWGWLRQPMQSARDLGEWLGEPTDLPEWQPGVATQAYLVSTSRPDLALQARFISRVPLVVLGAGGVLALGLMLSWSRFLRSLPLLCLLAVAITLPLVTHTETALLFLQPALLGGALLLFYFLIDRLVRRDVAPLNPPAPLPSAFESTLVSAPTPAGGRLRSGVVTPRNPEVVAPGADPRSSRP